MTQSVASACACCRLGAKFYVVLYRAGAGRDASKASPAGANWINIRPDFWNSFHRGDTVRVHIGAGVLAILWYAVGHCAE